MTSNKKKQASARTKPRQNQRVDKRKVKATKTRRAHPLAGGILKEGELSVEVGLFGADPDTIEAISRSLPEHPLVREYLGNVRSRMLWFQLLDPDRVTKSEGRPTFSTRFRATFYDYDNNRAIFVDGDIRKPKLVEISESGSQPLPSDDEFDAAVRILEQDLEIGAAIREGRLEPYRPMPPLLNVELPDGRMERTLAIGLRSNEQGPRHRIVGVNMIRDEVLHNFENIPLPSDDDCGPPAAGGCESSTSLQARVRIRQGSTVLWTFIVVRPSASSGTNGSGVELRFVNYRGKQVLYRAHVPILNVEYFAGAGCGPTYRDWQNSENCFEAFGTDPIPGFRLCSSPARTILDSGSDNGNFRGVAIYVLGTEVVLVSEMQAGWYRYISEWRFDIDGTIRPRFGFGAADNPCTCSEHHHHVYWRFDFDIDTAAPNLVEEFNDPPLFGASNWHQKTFEIRRLRNQARKRKWRVTNTNTGDSYELIPGTNDGNASAYGVGDLWVLLFRGSSPPPIGEGDDGQGFTTNPASSMAHLDNFITGDPVMNRDVVIWYAAHFLHAPGSTASHIVGPELVPSAW